jgi:3-oxocholest-4-en-26-oate---CoA ligase
MEMHFATVWEAFADAIPDATAVVHGSQRRTWREFDDRAARLAAAFSQAGLGPNSKIGMYLYNANEYLETQYAGFKMRGVPVNVNYRYLDEELWYLLDNADAEALVFHSSLGDRVARVAGRLAGLKLLVEVDDGGTGQVPGAVAYDTVLADHVPMDRIARSEDDIYMLYTGGTTGMPKGVMYDIGGLTRTFVNGGFPLVGLTPPADAAQLAPMIKEVAATTALPVSIPGCPLMHGTGVWLGAFIAHLAGGNVVTLGARSFDAHEMFAVAQQHAASALIIVGDSFARPMIKALDEAAARGEPYDTSTLKIIVSSGVMFTAELKDQLLDRIGHVMIVDAMGSTEGSMGMSVSMKGMPAGTAKFNAMPGTKVFTDDGREVTPGSDEIGMVASGGNVPIGYYKDPDKTARTFRTIDGVRYSFPGDMAMVGADGSLILLGRGSQVINSGGEKIFPEEVEEAVKRVEGVVDCLVVGVDDEKFGQAVTAVAAVAPGVTLEEAAVIAAVKSQIAGYKAPKRVVFVAQVPRAPNGKADYKTAKQYAVDALESR